MHKRTDTMHSTASVQHSQDKNQPSNATPANQAALGLHLLMLAHQYAHTGSSVPCSPQVKLLALVPGRGEKDKYDRSFLS